MDARTNARTATNQETLGDPDVANNRMVLHSNWPNRRRRNETTKQTSSILQKQTRTIRAEADETTFSKADEACAARRFDLSFFFFSFYVRKHSQDAAVRDLNYTPLHWKPIKISISMEHQGGSIRCPTIGDRKWQEGDRSPMTAFYSNLLALFFVRRSSPLLRASAVDVLLL